MEGLLEKMSSERHFEEGEVHGIDINRRLFLGRRQVTLENTNKTKVVFMRMPESWSQPGCRGCL